MTVEHHQGKTLEMQSAIILGCENVRLHEYEVFRKHFRKYANLLSCKELDMETN